MENVKIVLKEVVDNINQRSTSKKDEITVMKALMNDPEYTVDVYEKNKDVTQYAPGKEIRKMISNVISETTGMSSKEASELVKEYDFTKSDAKAVVNLSKEFINTYLQTGRKLSLGGRETSNIELLWKDIPERTSKSPLSKSSEPKTVPAHGGIRAINKCPKWIE